MAVYFFEAVGTNRVKIGYTGNVQQRQKDIQVYCPVPLLVRGIIPHGTLEIEREVHRRFKRERWHNEWFELSARLSEFIAALPPAQYPPPKRYRLTAIKREALEALWKHRGQFKPTQFASATMISLRNNALVVSQSRRSGKHHWMLSPAGEKVCVDQLGLLP